MGKDSTLAPGYHINPGRTEKLYHKEQETDDSWPSIGAVLKLLISVRIVGTLWSVIGETMDTRGQWKPLYYYHNMTNLTQNLFPFEPLDDIQCRILNVQDHKNEICYSKLLDQSQIAVSTVIRLMIALACIGAEYYAFRVISERINISAGRYFLIFSIFSYGMFHASVTFSLHTVSMICSFFFLGGILDDKRWLCWVTWIISFTLGSWHTFCFTGLTIIASWVWQCSLRKQWIGKQLFALAAIASSIVLYSCSHAYLPIYLRTLYPFQATHEYLSTVKVSVRPPTTTFYFIQDFISNWNVAAVLALVGPYLGCITCWKFQKHRDIWKTWNDPSSIIFLSINSTYWLIMFFLLGQHESFLFPLYPNISLFVAIACAAIPRLWHRKEDDPIIEKGRQPSTDPFLWLRKQAHSSIIVLVGFYIICSIVVLEGKRNYFLTTSILSFVKKWLLENEKSIWCFLLFGIGMVAASVSWPYLYPQYRNWLFGGLREKKYGAASELSTALEAKNRKKMSFEETIRRLESEKGVVGIIVVDSAGRVIHSTIDSDATQSHAAFFQELCEKTKTSIQGLDSSNDLTFLRLRTKKNEIMIEPDKDHIIMVIKELS